MADNFVKGYTFDGTTGLKTGANLEDLITLAVFAAGAADTGNATRLFDGSTIDLDASNRAQVADAGIGVDQIAAAIAGTGLSGGAGTALSVDVPTVAAAMDGNGLQAAGSFLNINTDEQGFEIIGGQLALELDGTTLSKSASGLKVNAIGASQITDGTITAAKLDTMDCFLVDKNGTNQVCTVGATDLVWDTSSPVINVGSGTFPTNNRYRPGIAGIWEFTLIVTHLSIATNINVNTEIRKNTTLIAQSTGDVSASAANSQRSIVIRTFVNMNGTTDYIKAGFNVTTSTVTVYGADYSTLFMGRFIGQAS